MSVGLMNEERTLKEAQENKNDMLLNNVLLALKNILPQKWGDDIP